jgi:hypothetical protein
MACTFFATDVVNTEMLAVTPNERDLMERVVPLEERSLPEVIKACHNMQRVEIKHPEDIRNIPASWHLICIVARVAAADALAADRERVQPRHARALRDMEGVLGTAVVSEADLKAASQGLAACLDAMRSSPAARSSRDLKTRCLGVLKWP